MGDNGAAWNGTVRLLPERLDQPLRWTRPRRIFVDSISDLFHPAVPLDFLAQVWRAMHDAHRLQRHVFQVLTKRPQLMPRRLGPRGIGWYGVEGPVLCPEPGIWLGTSIESDRFAFRADHLRATPAAVRFLSLEPLLGPLPSLDLAGIDWVIVGGESGPKARPMSPEWVRQIRDRCLNHPCERCDGGRRLAEFRGSCPCTSVPVGGHGRPGVRPIPFLFKQWGEWRGFSNAEFAAGVELAATTGAIHRDCGGFTAVRVGKKAAGRLLDGVLHDEYPA